MDPSASSAPAAAPPPTQPSQDNQHGTKRQLDEQINTDAGAKRPRTDAQDAVPDAPSNANGGVVTESNGVAESARQLAAESKQNESVKEVQAKTIVDAPVAETRGLPKGTAPIKQEYLVKVANRIVEADGAVDDDAAEAKTTDSRDRGGDAGGDKKKKRKGLNEKRDFGRSQDAKGLCYSRATFNENSPGECRFERDGKRCNVHHNIREYLAEGRRPDLEVFSGQCPIYEVSGDCPMGWKCLFVKSHSEEVTHEDGTKELVLLKDPSRKKTIIPGEESFPGTVNNVPTQRKIELSRKKYDFSKSQAYVQWLEKDSEIMQKIFNSKQAEGVSKTHDQKVQEYRAAFIEPPLKPAEKRRVYFGRETPVLAPLTTQGNLPFRRLCVEMGAGLTYSEMAVGLHVLQGQKHEWALLKAHESETRPPRFENPSAAPSGYDNSRDLKFAAQIAANQPWVALKTTQALVESLPHLRLIDINCGCPIDMVFKSGAGSALLDAPAKLERMIRGMNTVSGEVPITCKLRLGVRDGKPTAQKTIERLAFGESETSNAMGAPGCAAITLHGRSRQQRYRSDADWGYIANCAAMIQQYKKEKAALTDTVRAPDDSTLPNGGKMFFIGNGDCYSHVDYFDHIDNARVDTVMIARGALIKPWIFEEIEKGQYLDKSASERLSYIEKFSRYGIECWGSDEMGIGATRKFLLEYLSFTHRYVPIGLLEHLPPKINDRPPAYRGRDDLETLLASNNFKDWIKISEMFLGPAPDGFKFEPKHKSNAYEVEAEG